MVRRQPRGVRRDAAAAGGGRHRASAGSPEAPGLLPRALGSRRRGARRGSNLHLLPAPGRRRAEQQLARSRGDEADAARLVRGQHAGQDPVCGSLQHGSDRLPDRPDRRPADRLALRRREHAHHDAHGQARVGCARRRILRALPALGGRAARAGPAGRRVAVQRRQQVHRPLPRNARDLVVRIGLRRQRAARQEMSRAAHRLRDGARRGLARRAHADPQAHLSRGTLALSGRSLPERLRKDEPRDGEAEPARLEGGDDRRRHRLDEVRRRRQAVRDQPRGGFFRRRARHQHAHQPECDADAHARRALHELRSHARRRRLVGGADQAAARKTD